MMKPNLNHWAAALVVGICLLASPAGAHSKKCPKNTVQAGDLCVDTFEASVWLVPDPFGANKKLVKKIRAGKIIDPFDLAAAGAVQRGLAGDDYGLCSDHGLNCVALFAVSVEGATPSSHLTWFQAQQACANSGKRLPTAAEWQQAVAGTPDPGGDDGVDDCHTDSGFFIAMPTGSRGSCVSTFGAYDMVGNLWEWTANWVPRATAAPGWGTFSNDFMALSGASDTAQHPGAIMRGGFFGSGSAAGPLAVTAAIAPYDSTGGVGVRCVR